jgi:hypothetical protein
MRTPHRIEFNLSIERGSLDRQSYRIACQRLGSRRHR